MAKKEQRLLRIGVLGAGQIAQAAHFESCAKARNAELTAICDVAEDLRQRMAITHDAKKTYAEWTAAAKAAGTIAPAAKLENEKPKGETVDYDTLIKSWPATPPKK